MTDDRSAFERQLTARLERMAGPEPDVDVAASVRAATAPTHRWRFQGMFSAAKLFVAGAVVAVFGGYLLVDVVNRSDGDLAPGAQAVGASCPEAAALVEARASGQTADPSIISQVHLEPFGDDAIGEDGYTIDESDGYARVVFSVDSIAIEADDERLSGLFSGEVTAHFFTEEHGYMSGSVSIDNDDGSWSGHVKGFDDGWSLQFELIGDGAYAGCAASLHNLVESDGSSGVVFPASALAEE